MYQTPDSLLHICSGVFLCNALLKSLVSNILVCYTVYIQEGGSIMHKEIYGFDYDDVSRMSLNEIVIEMTSMAVQADVGIADEELLQDKLDGLKDYRTLKNELTNRYGASFVKTGCILLIKENILLRRIEIAREDRNKFENKYIDTREEININIAQDISCDLLIYLDGLKNVKGRLKKLGVADIENRHE